MDVVSISENLEEKLSNPDEETKQEPEIQTVSDELSETQEKENVETKESHSDEAPLSIKIVDQPDVVQNDDTLVVKDTEIISDDSVTTLKSSAEMELADENIVIVDSEETVNITSTPTSEISLLVKLPKENENIAENTNNAIDDNVIEKTVERDNIAEKTVDDNVAKDEVKNPYRTVEVDENIDVVVDEPVILSESPETSSNSIENKVAALEKSTEEENIKMADEQQNISTTNGVEDTATVVSADDASSASTSSSDPQLQIAPKQEEVLQEKLLKLPLHLMGHDLEKPVDSVKNGRVTFTPRLGVKVPYKNLTSQIVSKQEITDEIMERSRQRQAAAELAGNIIFAKKLTNRLAQKLSPSGKSLQSLSETTTAMMSNDSRPSPPVVPSSDRIANNSDLIALLEGDDDTEWNAIDSKKSSPVKSADWERETALKQLAELPKLGKKEVEEEPRFAINPVTKTYTRKRKPSEDIKAILDAAKKPTLSPNSNSTKTSHTSSSSKTSVNIHKSSVMTPKSSSSQKVGETSQKISSTPLKAVQTIQKTPSVQKQSSKVTPISKPKNTDEQKTHKQPSTSSVPKLKPSDSKVTVNVNQKSDSLKQVGDLVKTPVSGHKPVLGQKQLASNQKPLEQKSKIPTKPSKTLSIQKSIQNIRNLSTQSTPTATPSLPLHAKLSTDKKAIIILSNTPEDENKDSLTKEVSSETDQKTPLKKPLSPNTYISKSSRIIKRKKIWDPDEITPMKIAKSPKSVETTTANQVTNVEKKINSVEKNIGPVEKKITLLAQKNSVEKHTAKKIMKKVIAKKKKTKRLTEIDRLLMDEGAVNLLYAVKNTEPVKKKKKSFFSIDKAERELLNKTNEIKNDLLQNNRVKKDTPIALRKKVVTPKAAFKDPAAIILHRKKSKDSVEGSVHAHTPPASPAYTFHENVSRIIRRHSSSSFTSKESDEEGASEATGSSKKKKVDKQRKTSTTAIGEDNVMNEVMIDGLKYSEFKTFNVRKFDNLVQIILVPILPNAHITLTLKAFNELTQILNLLQLDSECRVVLLTSAGNSFCLGIDYKELVAPNVKERKTVAKQYATTVRDFLLALANFSKLLVAGVHGNAVGLGVTMLPLFDMVLASDTATFSTPYARLGCAAEGGILLKLPHVMHNALASELFFASRKLTAAEGLRLGLVTRTLWPDKFQEELISGLKVISSQSLQSMVAIKKQLRQQLLTNVEEMMKSETSILMQHWISNECQSTFANYNFESK